MSINSPRVRPYNPPSSIIYLGEYRPRRHHCPLDRFSSMIRQLKFSTPEALEYFLPLLNPVLPPGWAVSVVPPHIAGQAESGVTNLARAAASTAKRLDATSVLIRHATIPKLSFGGTRTERTHFDSIRVSDAYPIEGLHIVLLDDVVTTGCSMRACKTILLANGAQSVLPIALAKAIL